MKKILIPTDFSDAASNAAHFIAAWSHHSKFSEIILLNSYAPFRKEIYLIDVLESEEFDVHPQVDSALTLQKLRDTLHPISRADLNISMVSTAASWEEAITVTVSREHVDLLATGILPLGKNTRDTIGYIAGEIARSLEIPVLLIPVNVSFKPIDALVLTCDPDLETPPISALSNLLAGNPARIFAVYVGSGQSGAEALEDKQTVFQQMLEPHRVEFHFIEAEDVVSAIIGFAIDKRASLILASPQKHTFFERLFHTSVSQHLAESASVPVMLLYK